MGMRKLVRNIIKRPIRAAGFDVVRYTSFEHSSRYADISENDKELIRSVKPYTMTSFERIYSLVEAVRYIVQNEIPGDIVECGVWRGGSMLAVAKTLVRLNNFSKELYLFDTFEGMTSPAENDVDWMGAQAFKKYQVTKSDNGSSWSYASEKDVRRTMSLADYDEGKIHYVKGKVEDTLPGQAPDTISLLRLDTDWYESTRHELIHLFSRLSRGGILILDDYGHWKGARKAVDEFIAEHGLKLFLSRIDCTGRISVKL